MPPSNDVNANERLFEWGKRRQFYADAASDDHHESVSSHCSDAPSNVSMKDVLLIL